MYKKLKKFIEFTSFLYYSLLILRHNIVCRKRLLIPLYKNKVTDNMYEHDENVIIYLVQPETPFSGG